MTLRQYYRSFKGIYGVLAGVFSAIPLFSKFLPEGYGASAFPPLGNADGPARIVTCVIALSMTYLAFFTRAAPPLRNNRRIVAAIALAVVSVCLYLTLFLLFVRTVDIPSMNSSVRVSVGYERTDFANANFGAASDEELLRDRGTNDEEIRRLWTAKSLIISRLGLYTTYALFIFALVLAFSWGALDQLNQG
jgi:hypothetical protein